MDAEKTLIVSKKKYRELYAYKCAFDIMLSMLKDGITMNSTDAEWLERTVERTVNNLTKDGD